MKLHLQKNFQSSSCRVTAATSGFESWCYRLSSLGGFVSFLSPYECQVRPVLTSYEHAPLIISFPFPLFVTSAVESISLKMKYEPIHGNQFVRREFIPIQTDGQIDRNTSCANGFIFTVINPACMSFLHYKKVSETN